MASQSKSDFISDLKIVKDLCHVNTQDCTAFMTFLNYFKSSLALESSSSDFVLTIDGQTLKSPADVLRAAETLRTDPTCTKEDFLGRLFPLEIGDRRTNRSIRAVMRIAYMVDCASKDDFSRMHHLSSSLARWEHNQSFIAFASQAFPVKSSFPRNCWTRSMKAWKIWKRCGISIEPTNDMVQHLVYDKAASTIKVFRHVKWLKCQISHTQHRPLSDDCNESLRYGTLPPQLLLETLVTIYYVLFPLHKDSKSLRYVKKLIEKINFDPELCVYSGSIRELPDNFECRYWGERLHTIKRLTENPPATNKVTSWIERHTSERNALTVALIGVFLAALFGFLSCLIGIAQLAVSIMALRQSNGH